jgi:hypothetical protein
MSVSSSISRITVYFRRNGFRATVRRFDLAVRRALFSGRMILFYCDLPTLRSSVAAVPGTLRVERHKNQIDPSQLDLQQITSFWNPALAERNLKQRFDLGASLWLIKFEDDLAGYGWTLQGRTVEPHYFRLGPEDVHLFDFHVFPQYRGRGANPFLVSYILRSLTTECQGRAFIEAAEWNKSQLASLMRTPFRIVGSARWYTIFCRTLVWWDPNRPVEQKHELEKQSFIAAGNNRGTSVPDLRSEKS